MGKDIVPELLEAIQKDFAEMFENSKTIQRIESLIADNNATYAELNEYAVELGEMLSEALEGHISSDTLPDGKMYYNIAERIFNSTMSNNHNIVAEKAAEIQTALNHESGIGIRGIEPELNQDRIDGIIERASNEDHFDDVSWIIEEPMVNFTQSVVDDAIKTNAEFHVKSGLSPKIIRKAESNCCKWCSNLAGTYEYPDYVPGDVYRRHRNCRCTVEYEPGNGSKKRQNVWTKKESGSDEDREMRIKQEQKWAKQNEVDKDLRGQVINEVKIKGGTEHLMDRMEQRSINTEDIIYAIKNPLEITKTEGVEDRKSFKVIGEKCTVVINPDNGKIITTYKTNSKTVKKLKGEDSK